MLKENAEISTKLGEARDVGKIGAEIREMFEKKKEHFELIFIEGNMGLDGGLLVKNMFTELLNPCKK